MDGDTIGTNQMRGFTQNVDDRMVRFDMLEGIESVSQFEYDAMGRRLISTDNDGNQTLYYYDGIRVILEKTKPSGSGTWSTSKVYTLQEGAIGFIISSRDTATGDDTWYHYDRLGTVMSLTDATGAVIATYSQDAFGNILSGSTDGFHLTTKDYNSTIGLYYFYMRWYDPVLGRFSTKSPMPSFREHPYIYSENNPYNKIDTTGEHSHPYYSLCVKICSVGVGYPPCSQCMRLPEPKAQAACLLLCGWGVVEFCEWWCDTMLPPPRPIPDPPPDCVYNDRLLPDCSQMDTAQACDHCCQVKTQTNAAYSHCVINSKCMDKL